MKLFTISIIVFISFTTATAAQASAYKEVFSYLKTLLDKDIIKIKDIKKILEKKKLYNPISRDEAYSSHTTFIYWQQLNKIVEAHKGILDKEELKSWCQSILVESENENKLRQEAHKVTEDIYQPLRFIPIQAGRYKSISKGEYFSILEGLELSETPITEYQWASIMQKLPKEIEEAGTQEVTIDYTTFTMDPNSPIAHVSLNNIEEYLDAINQADDEYEYILPSIEEYEAFFSSSLGDKWIEKIWKAKERLEEKTSRAIYNEHLKSSLGIVWEFTRDTASLYTLKSEKMPCGLVFGGSLTTLPGNKDLYSITRPMFYKDTKGATLGFRLLRYKKMGQAKTSEKYALQFNQGLVQYDSQWRWDASLGLLIHKDDCLRVMIDNKEKYPSTVQHTLETMLQAGGSRKSRFATIRKMKSLILPSNKGIQDITPISFLEQLTYLNLSNNTIIDNAPIQYLKNLQKLELANNKIKSIESLKGLNIEILNLTGNEIEDISSLSSLSALKHVYLAHNPIQSLEPLASIATLTDVHLDTHQAEQLNPKTLVRPSVKIHIHAS